MPAVIGFAGSGKILPTLGMAGPVTNINLSSTSASEDTPIDSVVATISSDKQASYSVVADPDFKFYILGSELYIKNSFDYETKTSHSVTIRANNAAGDYDQSFTFTVTNVAEAATSITLDNTTIPENAEIGALVGNLSSSTGSSTFTIQSDPDGKFSLMGNALVTADTFDFETAASHSVTIRAEDGGETYDQVFSITITDIAEAATSISLSSETVPESATVGTVIATIVSNTGASTFSITSDLDNKFSISASELVLANAVDYETKTSHNVTIRATDGGETYDQAFTITVTDVAEPPTDISLSSTSVPENATVGTAIGVISSDKAATYSIVGDPDGKFQITGNNLEVGAALDYETKTSHSVTIRATADGTYDEAFTITVTDVEEPATDITITSTSVAEDAAVGTVIGTMTAVGATGTFSILSDPDAKFQVSGNQLQVGAPLDYETKTSHNVTIRHTSDAGGTYDELFPITVTDVVEGGATTEASEKSRMIARHGLTTERLGKGFVGYNDVDDTPDNTTTFATLDDLRAHVETWKNAGGTTLEKCLLDFDGLQSFTTPSLRGPNTANLTAGSSEMGVAYNRPAGGIWIEPAAGRNPVIDANALNIYGMPRIFFKNIDFAGQSNAGNPDNQRTPRFQNNATFPLTTIAAMKGCNIGLTKHKPAEPNSEYIKGVQADDEYVLHLEDCVFDGCRDQVNGSAKYLRVFNCFARKTVSDFITHFGLSSRMGATAIWVKGNIILDLIRDAALTGLHTDFTQLGTSGDAHAGTDALYEENQQHSSTDAFDSGSQGHYQDDKTVGYTNCVAIDNVLAATGFHMLAAHDPSGAGHFFFNRNTLMRSGRGYRNSSNPSDSVPRIACPPVPQSYTHPGSAGGLLHFNDNVLADINPVGANSVITSQTGNHYVTPKAGHTSGDGSSAAQAKRPENYFNATAVAAFTRDQDPYIADYLIYDIPGESTADTRAKAWYVLRDFFEPADGWGFHGGASDPANWDSAPARPAAPAPTYARRNAPTETAYVAGPNFPAGTSSIVTRWQGRVWQAGTGVEELFEWISTTFLVGLDTRSGQQFLRITVEEAGGAKLILAHDTAGMVFNLNEHLDIITSVQHNSGGGNGEVLVWINGTQVVNQTPVAVGSQDFTTVREVRIVENQANLDFAQMDTWYNASVASADTSGLGAADWTVTGDQLITPANLPAGFSIAGTGSFVEAA